MPNPNVHEPASPQARLGSVYARKHRDGDGRAVWDPGRKARHGRAIPQLEFPVTRQSPNVGLGESGFDEGKPRSALRCRSLAGSVVGQVADVDAQRDRGPASSRKGFDPVHERGLAPVTTIAVVGEVARILHLCGSHGLPWEIPLVSQPTTALQFAVPERSRVGGGQQDRLLRQCPPGSGSEERRVDAARECDDHRTHSPDCLEKASFEAFETREHTPRVNHSPTPSRSSPVTAQDIVPVPCHGVQVGSTRAKQSPCDVEAFVGELGKPTRSQCSSRI